MKNYFGDKTNNILINKLSTTNLAALSVFLIYFFSITLAPIVNGVISARHNNLFINAQNKNFNLRAQILKLKTNGANIITGATYINNGQMLARQIDNNNLQSYISDAKGSVLKLNNFDGSNSQNYSYDAYGNIINTALSSQKISVTTNSAITQGLDAQSNNFAAATINPFQYNGERTDANTALQYLRARFYNPEIKRFINQDTYSLLNKFGYVDGNPVMKTDPSGHNPVSDWWHNNEGRAASIEIFSSLVAALVIFRATKYFVMRCVAKYRAAQQLMCETRISDRPGVSRGGREEHEDSLSEKNEGSPRRQPLTTEAGNMANNSAKAHVVGHWLARKMLAVKSLFTTRRRKLDVIRRKLRELEVQRERMEIEQPTIIHINSHLGLGTYYCPSIRRPTDAELYPAKYAQLGEEILTLRGYV